MTSNVAKCLLVSKVLVADGMVDEDERSFLKDLMSQLGLTPEEKLALVELLVDAASADGHLSPKEMATIKHVEQALGLK